MIIRLQRKGSYRGRQPIAASSPPLYHLQRHPEMDYYPYYSTQPATSTWIGQHRQNMARQLVTIRELRRTGIADIHKLACVVHDNIAKPVSFYHMDESLFVVHEYLYLDVFDLLPLSAMEISSIMKQVTSGLQCLKRNSVMFGIDIVRVDISGVVKIDWNLECDVESTLQEANEAYLVAYLEGIMTTISQSCRTLPSVAIDFLTSRVLPDIDHPFISHASGPSILQKAVEFAMQKKVLAS